MPRNPLNPRTPARYLSFMEEVSTALSTDMAKKTRPPNSLLEGYAALVRELDMCSSGMRSYSTPRTDEKLALRRHLVRLVVVACRVAMTWLPDEGPSA